MLNNVEQRLLTAMDYYFNNSMYEMKTKIVDNDGKKMTVFFPKKNFLDFMRINHYYKLENGGLCNDIIVLKDKIKKGELRKLSIDKQNYLSSISKLLYNICPIDMNHINCIINNNGEKYLLMQNDESKYILKLEQIRPNKNVYNVTEFLSAKNLKKLMEEGTISIPVTCGYGDFFSYEDDEVEMVSLYDIVLKERLDVIKKYTDGGKEKTK